MSNDDVPVPRVSKSGDHQESTTSGLLKHPCYILYINA
jgi:hypothetical protein